MSNTIFIMSKRKNAFKELISCIKKQDVFKVLNSDGNEDFFLEGLAYKLLSNKYIKQDEYFSLDKTANARLINMHANEYRDNFEIEDLSLLHELTQFNPDYAVESKFKLSIW